MGGYEELCEKVNEEAMEVYEEVRCFIKKIIRNIKNYNTCYEEEDYEQEAYLAVVLAVTKYNEFRKFGTISIDSSEDVEAFQELKKNPAMKLQTFTYWFLQKKLYKMADTGEVKFLVGNNGDEIILSSEEYHKNRKKHKKAKSFRIKYNFSELSFDNTDGTEKELEPVNYEMMVKIRNNNFKF